MRTTHLILTAFLLQFAQFSFAQEPILPEAEQFAEKLGWSIHDAFTNLGYPKHMFVHRGEVQKEDNIVFYYADHLYLFWFQDRVWQVRADENWTQEVDGVRMGMNRNAVEELWGSPINRIDEDPTWTLSDRGYPIRIRLYFREDRLIDLYVYRSDW